MSLKKDASGRRSIQVEVEVPGTPEDVWRAIATGPGITAWFVPTVFEEKAGTPISLTMSFGPGMDAAAKITQWNPPHRFAAEGELAPGSPSLATEWIVEAKAGGTCIVRVVHSLFASTDDWDNQLKDTEQGWPGFFRILLLYLTHFRGMSCTSTMAMALTQGPEAAVWKAVTGPLALAGVTKGQAWKAPAGVPPLGGTVEEILENDHMRSVLVRLDAPAPGVASVGTYNCGGPIQVCLSLYLYGDRAPAAITRDQALWQTWLNERFPAEAPASGMS
jgi:uncharacterized protein YndB with AHSA1/START domain